MKSPRPQRSRCEFANRPPSRLAARLLLGLAIGLLVSGPGFAADDDEKSHEEMPWLETTVEAGYFHQFESDLDDDGKFDAHGAYAKGQLAIRLTDKVRIRTVGTYHGAGYEFDDPPTIAGSAFKPWNTIHVARLNPMLDVEITERWRVFGGPLIEASLENGADLTNGLKPGGLVGAEYIVLPDQLTVGLGLIGVAEIEGDPYFQPLILIEWRPRDDLTIRAESWTTRGGTLEMAYRPIDQIEIAPSITYRRERFRLKERAISTSPPPPVFRTGSKGIGEDRAVVPALRLSYFPEAPIIKEIFGKLRIDLDVSVAVAGDLTLENRNGSQIQTSSYDPAPAIGIGFLVPL